MGNWCIQRWSIQVGIGIIHVAMVMVMISLVIPVVIPDSQIRRQHGAHYHTSNISIKSINLLRIIHSDLLGSLGI
jgi:hypothetical protein